MEHRFGLVRRGHHAEHVFCRNEGGYGERNGVFRHFFEGVERLVVHLLAAAFFVEVDEFHRPFILKIGHVRIVESDMPVFPDAEADDIDGVFSQKPLVSFAQRFGVPVAAYVVDRLHLNAVENRPVEIMRERLIAPLSQPDVFVHVESRYARPIHFLLREIFEYVVLRGRRRENHVDLALAA